MPIHDFSCNSSVYISVLVLSIVDLLVYAVPLAFEEYIVGSFSSPGAFKILNTNSRSNTLSTLNARTHNREASHTPIYERCRRKKLDSYKQYH
jgi:hypothetical protein